eukprot:SAG31_NODE_3004_length_4795_cov_2.802598_6_plen_79_part_00
MGLFALGLPRAHREIRGANRDSAPPCRLYYWDVTGKRFFDGIGGIFTVSVGHGHPAVNDAVKRQLDLMTFAPPMHGAY